MSDGRGDDDEERSPLRPAEPTALSQPEPLGSEPPESEPLKSRPLESDAFELADERFPLRPRDSATTAPIQVVPPHDWPPAAAPIPIGPPLPPSREPPAPPVEVTIRQLPPRRRPLVVRLLLLLVKAVAIFVLGSVLWVLAYRFVGPPVTLTMVGDFFGGGAITRQWMPLGRIDPVMARAAIAAEDSRFCTHNGFDFEAIEAAYKRNQRGGRIRGGSTISQQTAKNAFLWQGGGYLRKGLEAWFTFLIENLWGKRRIMEVYLNVAETGIATYGVNAGALRYFGHDASRMTAREAAQIAAVLPLPKRRAGTDPRGFTRRYGNAIVARINVVRSEGLDACLR